MKKKLILLLFILDIALSTVLNAQNDTTKLKHNTFKHSVGIQINPYLRSYYIRRNDYPLVFALRYGFKYNHNIRTGVEFSSFFVNIPYNKSTKINLGLYARYSIFKKNFQPFIEINSFGYYRHSISDYDTIYNINGTPSPIERTKYSVDYFISPGATFYFLNKRISLDLLFKYNHKIKRGLSLGPLEFSYRINYHFNRIKFK